MASFSSTAPHISCLY